MLAAVSQIGTWHPHIGPWVPQTFFGNATVSIPAIHQGRPTVLSSIDLGRGGSSEWSTVTIAHLTLNAFLYAQVAEDCGYVCQWFAAVAALQACDVGDYHCGQAAAQHNVPYPWPNHTTDCCRRSGACAAVLGCNVSPCACAGHGLSGWVKCASGCLAGCPSLITFATRQAAVSEILI